MRKRGLIISILALMAAGSAGAAEPNGKPRDCQTSDAPYHDYDCLDAYLGEDLLERLTNYYRLEWGHEAPPTDSKAPPSRRDQWPATPVSTPPFPFTEWPYGGATALGVTRPSSIDSPLMVALGNTELGRTMNDNHIQVYGWVDLGGNISSSAVTPGGNFPAADMYSPNTATLDQAVVYLERLPDTVQTDHVDWGFRLSADYGEDNRYTTAYGLASYQLLGHNLTNIYDFPMIYGELFFPQVSEGLLVRLGRYGAAAPDADRRLRGTEVSLTRRAGPVAAGCAGRSRRSGCWARRGRATLYRSRRAAARQGASRATSYSGHSACCMLTEISARQ